jgi:signal transduction histidine kinase
MAHLLDNAVKFTPKGGAIAVRAGGGEVLVFEVADAGPGIPEDSLHRILEVFYQVDGSVTRQFGGVGLGLAFARRVAEAHGGTLSWSRADGRTRFAISLPEQTLAASAGGGHLPGNTRS